MWGDLRKRKNPIMNIIIIGEDTDDFDWLQPID